MAFDVLTISTKGQVVLPNDMRKALSLSVGDKIIAYCNNGTIVLKKLELPSIEEFDEAIEECSNFAKDNNIQADDINKIIKRYRAEKKC